MEKEREMTVAVCSYDMGYLSVLGRYLAACGGIGRCTAYRTGAELLRESAAGTQFDVYILDDRMQDMDVLELLERLPYGNALYPPILVLTAPRAFFENDGGLLPRRVHLCLTKPFRVQTLLVRLRSLQAERGSGLRARCEALCRAWGAEEAVSVAYLAAAVAVMARAGERPAIRKEILAVVGEEYGVSVSAVDSGIRRLIACLGAADVPAYRNFRAAEHLENKNPNVGQMLCALVHVLGPEGKDRFDEYAQ